MSFADCDLSKVWMTLAVGGGIVCAFIRPHAHLVFPPINHGNSTLLHAIRRLSTASLDLNSPAHVYGTKITIKFTCTWPAYIPPQK